MIGTAAESLTQKLRSYAGIARIHKTLYIDTFKLPYYEFEDKFTWPQVSVSALQADQAESIIHIIGTRLGPLLDGFSVLPGAFPERDEPSLVLVKEHFFQERIYIEKLKIFSTYMGGAENDDVLTERTQDLSPSFQSRRIYFQKVLLPVVSAVRNTNQLVSYEPVYLDSVLKYRPLDLHSTQERDEFRSTSFFDQHDYTDVQQLILKQLLSGGLYKPGSLFFPFIVQQSSLAWNCFSVVSVSSWIRRFDKIITILANTGPPFQELQRLTNDWANFFASWQIERLQSRAGNPHWKFIRAPDEP